MAETEQVTLEVSSVQQASADSSSSSAAAAADDGVGIAADAAAGSGKSASTTTVADADAVTPSPYESYKKSGAGRSYGGMKRKPFTEMVNHYHEMVSFFMRV